MRNLRRWGLGLVTALGLTALPVAAETPIAVTLQTDKPGPQISRGRNATVARLSSFAASRNFSAMSFVAGYGALKLLP